MVHGGGLGRGEDGDALDPAGAHMKWDLDDAGTDNQPTHGDLDAARADADLDDFNPNSISASCT